MDLKKFLVLVFPLALIVVILLGYCIKGTVGPERAWIYSTMIVLMIGTTMIPPDDPEEQ